MGVLSIRATFVVASSFVTMLLGQSIWAQGNQTSEDVSAVLSLARADNAMNNAIWQAESKEEQKRLIAERAAKKKSVYFDLMELADKYPGSTGGLAALYWAAFIPTEMGTTRSAVDEFLKQAATADLDVLSEAISLGRNGGMEEGGNLEIARFLLDRVKEHSQHDKAAELLTCACRLSMGSHSDPQPTPIFVEAADLMVSQYAASPDIWNFCEILANSRWARPFEQHLKIILEVNEERAVRCAAAFALPAVIQLSPEDRQEEAAQLYQKFLDDFDGAQQLDFKQYHYKGVEEIFRVEAFLALTRLRTCPIGKPAPEIKGVDLDGKPMKLSDYRGKVVLLSFWATWCAPCMQMLPEEQALAERFAGESFAIVGVNGDSDIEAAQAGAAQHGVSWRSFRDEHAVGARISQAWGVHGWPTVYVIDREGILRKRLSDYESFDVIGETVAQLVVREGTSIGSDE